MAVRVLLDHGVLGKSALNTRSHTNASYWRTGVDYNRAANPVLVPCQVAD